MSAATEISGGGREVIAALDRIGGDVTESELIYQLGAGAAVEAFELAELGLVEARTVFTLTPAGREAFADG